MEPVKDIHQHLKKQRRIFGVDSPKNYWKGGTIGEEHNWICPTNWTLQRIPTESDKVIIPGGKALSSYLPRIQSDVGRIHHLSLGYGAELHLSEEGLLIIHGSSLDDNAILLDGGRIINEGQIHLIKPGQKGIELIDAHFINKGTLVSFTYIEVIYLANNQSIFTNQGVIDISGQW